MSSLTRPRGPLPARVYWRRRLVVGIGAASLVLGPGQVLTNGSDAADPAVATQVAAEPTAVPVADAAPTTAPPKKNGKKQKNQKTKQKKRPTLATPTGPCEPEDIVVEPEVPRPYGDPGILIRLKLRTKIADACTWQVSPESVTVSIISGRDDIWASRQCPRAVPTRMLVVRKAVSVSVGVWWSGRRSDDDCSRSTDWARVGYYHVIAAALGGEPTDLQFQLRRPPTTEVTKTVTPSPSPTADKNKKKKKKDRQAPSGSGSGSGAQPTDAPTGAPSGAVEPNG